MVSGEQLAITEKQLRDTKQIMTEMGGSLDVIVNRMHNTVAECVEKNEQPPLEALSIALAELKYIKDVLVGNITDADLMAHPDRAAIVQADDDDTDTIDAPDVVVDVPPEDIPDVVESVPDVVATAQEPPETALPNETKEAPTPTKTKNKTAPKRRPRKISISALFADADDDDEADSIFSSKSPSNKSSSIFERNGRGKPTLPDFLLPDEDDPLI
jgi:hypothetical protein